MKSVMISIKPYWVFLIIAKTMGWNIDKEKTVEVRKTYPQDDEWDKVGKIYCTKDKKSFNHIPKEYQPFMEKFLGKVIGEFICDDIFIMWDGYAGNRGEDCLTFDEREKYLQGNNGYGWHISNLKIYDEPKGKAKEYGDLAINIYTGCPHNCFYCFAPNVLHKDRKTFHSEVKPRENIVEAVKKQLKDENISGKLIHLCFTCDPYPTGYDTTPTREIIQAIKDSGNNVQILTKGDGSRDLDLLDENDWYGITLDGIGDGLNPLWRARVDAFAEAYKRGIKTWVSFEPVTDEKEFFVNLHLVAPLVDKVKIGKLNYHKSDIDWAEFGKKAEDLCIKLGLDYYIKESLRKEMEKGKI